jgi:hypothetical protein
MPRQTKYHIGVEIDKLTNSIQNIISGDSFPTDVHPISKADLKNVTKKNKWLLIGQKNLKWPIELFLNLQSVTILILFRGLLA